MNERDSELDALWRRHSRELPTPALDDAIRAAAHRAVHAKPSAALSRARAPWPAWATYAAAASIGAIAIGVWQLQSREADVMQGVVSDVPMRAVAPAARDAERGAALKREVVPKPDALQSGGAAGGPASATANANANANEPLNAAAAKPADADGAAASTTRAPVNVDGTRAPRTDGTTAPSVRESSKVDAQANAPAVIARTFEAPTDAKRVATAPGIERVAPSAMPAPAPEAMVAPAQSGNMPAPSSRLQAEASVPARQSAISPQQPAAMVAPPPSAPIAQAAPRITGNVSADNNAAAQMPRARAASDEEARDVAGFVDVIRGALARRDRDLAVATLNALRARYDDADARLPVDLRGWAAGVAHAKPRE